VSYTYATFSAALATLGAASSVTEPGFVSILPSVIDYAEQRIYRELDLLTTVSTDTSTAFQPHNRLLTLPIVGGAPLFITLQSVNAILPSGSTDPSISTRSPLYPASRDYLDIVYPSGFTANVPMYFAMLTDRTIVVGPWPDQLYTAELIGTIRPTPLSASNATTFLTLELPDLFMAASMVFFSGYQRNFGSQADDPRAAMSWETQFQTLKASAEVEEARRKYQSSAWSSYSPAKDAAPTR
jgi:hypothetical protein